ncbi:MAG: Amt family ammonium transporter [Cellvibrionaceae bacterium]|jgi:Amt family ammonium transporter
MYVNFFCRVVLVASFSSGSIAETVAESVPLNSINLVWLAVCITLVMLMQCGFLLLEGGMVRSKNAINVILKNFTDFGLGSMGFWLIGFGLMFGANSTGWIGTSNFAPSFTDSSSSLNLLYQMMFAVTAATIVSGAVAERFSFLPYILGAFIISAFIYPIFGSWVWGGDEQSPGWLAELGFHDMAGATVVHSIGGWCALGALLCVGSRAGRYSRKGAIHAIAGHNLPFVAMGGFVLWFGWFGFNGGAAAHDLSNLGKILLNTHFGAVGGLCGSIFWLALTKQGFYITRIVNGTLGGLVAVTAGADVFEPEFALLSGVIAGVLVVATANMLDRVKVDDVVGAVAVHGFCGAWGTLAVGFFYGGDMFNLERIVVQLIGLVAAFVWGVSTSYGVFWLINKVMALRVTSKIEQRGLDISEHKEIAYSDFMTTHVRADT